MTLGRAITTASMLRLSTRATSIAIMCRILDACGRTSAVSIPTTCVSPKGSTWCARGRPVAGCRGFQRVLSLPLYFWAKQPPWSRRCVRGRNHMAVHRAQTRHKSVLQ